MRTPLLATVVACAAACSGSYTTSGDSVAPGDGTKDGIYFRTGIQQDLEQKGCAAQGGCHGGTVAPMHLLAAPSTDQEWRSNYDQVLSRMGEGGEIPLIAKASGGGGHLALLNPADPLVARWTAWAEAGSPFDEPVEGGPDAGHGGSPDAGVDPDEAVTWAGNVAPLIDRLGCKSCHGTAGSYSLASYADALGNGSDSIANILPGNADSLLITYARDGHESIRYADALIIVRWIVDWDAREN